MFFQKSSSRPIESTFLLVGGSVWELKIDPKRLREEIKNDIEKRRKKNKQKTLRATKMLWDQTVPKILEALGPLENPHETPREPQERPK